MWLNQTETTQKLNRYVLRKWLDLKQTCVSINLTMPTEFDATMKNHVQIPMAQLLE